MIKFIKTFIEATRDVHRCNIEQTHKNWAWHLKSRPV